jgi:hypothetical protein
MQALAAAALVALAALPAEARAAPGPRLATIAERTDAAPSARLDLPSLDLGADLAARAPLYQRGRAAGDATPALALILGIIPGFGIGHLVANSPRWTTWLVVDVLLLAVWVIGSAVEPLDEGPLDTLFFVAVVVERVFEGLDAFKAAGGRLAAASRPGAGALALARPVRDPASGHGRL